MQATIRARSIVFTLCRTARIADSQYTRSVHLLVRRRSRCHISDFVRTETMNELQSIARLKIHPGKLEEFKRLAAKCMESVRTRDTGTLQYDWFFSSDYSECLVYERYRDSEAFVEHITNLGETMAALFETCSGSGEMRNAQPGADEGTRGLARADLLAVPVNLGRSGGSTFQPVVCGRRMRANNGWRFQCRLSRGRRTMEGKN